MYARKSRPTADTIVVKVGTRVLTHEDGTLDENQIARLGEEVCQLIESGRQVVLVSSGAVGAGMSQLGLQPSGRRMWPGCRRWRRWGRARLIEAYDRTFRKHGRTAAQVLLTADDVDDRTRYLNVRNTLRALLDFQAVPIINENDTVAVDELVATFGDNDRLAALVTNLLRAPLLVILSDVEGLYDGDPQLEPSRLVSTVRELDDIGAGLRARSAGRVWHGRDGQQAECGADRHDGGRECDYCQWPAAGRAAADRRAARRWERCSWHRASRSARESAGSASRHSRVVGSRSMRVRGRRLSSRDAACWRSGSWRSTGQFRKGDLVTLCDQQGREMARGLSNYHADEVQRIRGLRSDRIAQVLGHRPYEEVIHRDNMAVF